MIRIRSSILFCTVCLLPSILSAGVSEDIERYRFGYRSLIDFSVANPYLPILLLAGVLLAITTFYLPRVGLFVMLGFILIATDMPIGGGNSAGRSITIRIEDIVLILVSAGWFFNRSRTRNLAVLKRVPLYRPVAIMALVIVLATLVGYFQGTVSATRGFFFALKRLEYFWIFFMGLNIMESDNEAKNALKMLLVASVAISVISLVQYLFFPLSALTGGGATSTAGFGRANTTGDFLIIMLGISIGLLMYAKGKGIVVVYTTLVILFSVAVILSKSRGAYVSVLPLLFVIFTISRSKKAIIVLASLAGFVGLYFFVIAMASGAFSMLMERHHSDIGEQFTQIADVVTEGADIDPSLRSRMNSWRESVDQVFSYPILGQGCGAKRLGYSDNQYVRELLETGIVGFIVFMIMNISIFLFMLNYYLSTDSRFAKSLTLGFMGSHIGILFHGMTMSNFYTIFNMEVFWFLLAIVCVFYYNERRRRLTIEDVSVREIEDMECL